MAPEGHRPRPPGHDPRAAVHGRRRRVPADSARFHGEGEQEGLKAALRSALSDHAQAGTIALLDPNSFDTPSTKVAFDLLERWGATTPTVVVVTEEEASVSKSFRNLDRVLVTVPSELEVAHVVWARSLLVSESALDAVQGRAS